MLVLKVINSKNPTLSNCPEKEQYTFRDLYMPNALPWKRNDEGTIKRVIIGVYIKGPLLVKLLDNLSALSPLGNLE